MTPHALGVVILIVVVLCVEIVSLRRSNSIKRHERTMRGRKAYH